MHDQVEDERYQHDAQTETYGKIGNIRWNIRPQDVDTHDNVKQHGRQFSVPHGGVDPPCFFDNDQTDDPGHGFLEQKEQKQDDHMGKTADQAERNNDLRTFVRDRIQSFPEFRDHIVFSGDSSVQDIRQTG